MKKKLIVIFLAAILLLSAVVVITRESSVDSPVLTADRTEPWALGNPNLEEFGPVVVDIMEYGGKEYRLYPRFEDMDGAWEIMCSNYRDVLEESGIGSHSKSPEKQKASEYFQKISSYFMETNDPRAAILVDFMDIYSGGSKNSEIIAFIIEAESANDDVADTTARLKKMLPYGGRES